MACREKHPAATGVLLADYALGSHPYRDYLALHESHREGAKKLVIAETQ